MKTELLQAINAIVQRMPTVTVRDDTGLWTPNTETDIYAQLVTLREDTLPGHRCQAYSWNFETQEFRLNQDYRFGHPGTDSIAEPRLRCNVFALLSRSILLSSPVRLQIGSGQGVPATPAATLPTPLRPCLSATPRSGCPALAALPSGHRQRPDPAQHVTEQPPVQMSLGQQQPVVAGMFDQTAAGLH